MYTFIIIIYFRVEFTTFYKIVLECVMIGRSIYHVCDCEGGWGGFDVVMWPPQEPPVINLHCSD